MELEILKQKETPLLSRKRVSVMVSFNGPTPSRAKLRKEIASKLKESPEMVILRHIYTRFGKQKAKVIAHIYSDKKVMLKLEGKKLVEKHQPKESEKKEDAAEQKVAEEPEKAAKEENKEKSEAGSDKDNNKKGNKEEDSKEKEGTNEAGKKEAD